MGVKTDAVEKTDQNFGIASLLAFIGDSNAIEGIYRMPSDEEVSAYLAFHEVPHPGVDDLLALLAVVEPGAELRERPGMNVSVGGHVPPTGGAGVPLALDMLLQDEGLTPFELHHRFLFLHPFTDGNGRTARALWLHRRRGDAGSSFLQEWYYESLMKLDLAYVTPKDR